MSHSNTNSATIRKADGAQLHGVAANAVRQFNYPSSASALTAIQLPTSGTLRTNQSSAHGAFHYRHTNEFVEQWASYNDDAGLITGHGHALDAQATSPHEEAGSSISVEQIPTITQNSSHLPHEHGFTEERASNILIEASLPAVPSSINTAVMEGLIDNRDSDMHVRERTEVEHINKLSSQALQKRIQEVHKATNSSATSHDEGNKTSSSQLQRVMNWIAADPARTNIRVKQTDTNKYKDLAEHIVAQNSLPSHHHDKSVGTTHTASTVDISTNKKHPATNRMHVDAALKINSTLVKSELPGATPDSTPTRQVTRAHTTPTFRRDTTTSIQQTVTPARSTEPKVVYRKSKSEATKPQGRTNKVREEGTNHKSSAERPTVIHEVVTVQGKAPHSSRPTKGFVQRCHLTRALWRHVR